MAGGYYKDLKGKEKLKQQLKQRSLKGKKQLTVRFGYAAQYAIYVHEDLNAFHPIGNAKFLEGPLRRYRAQMAKIIKEKLLQKRSLEDALTAALEYLREKSQDEVPIDTGFLHDSWFARVE